ncbi:MAG: restriction endonuclease, SacI family [Chloroflexi bacterium]|nr:restriction endonuclease, SacI family [Chloroflexota bacterium]
MAIKLDFAQAGVAFDSALATAVSELPVAEEWLDRARAVATAPNKTFVAMLGTALLAKATDARIDSHALKVRFSERAYSARSLCMAVLVTRAVRHRVHLGTTGREPLNNQPFFRYDSVSNAMAVHPHVRPHLAYLVDCLDAVDALSRVEAEGALAAFLRARLQDGPGHGVPMAVSGGLPMAELISVAERFLHADPEGGKRGQALTAAAFDLVFAEVQTGRVNDPSRHIPGDVIVSTGERPITSVEVKQRETTETEILQFVEKLASSDVRRAIVVLLALSRTEMDLTVLKAESWDRHGVHLAVMVGTGSLLRAAFTWSGRPLEECLEAFPQLVAGRLAELEVRPSSVEAWGALFAQDLESLETGVSE